MCTPRPPLSESKMSGYLTFTRFLPLKKDFFDKATLNPGSAKASGREPKSYGVLVFNFKLGSFAILSSK